MLFQLLIQLATVFEDEKWHSTKYVNEIREKQVHKVKYSLLGDFSSVAVKL